jgi:uncharacterized protein (DUF1697 family)
MSGVHAALLRAVNLGPHNQIAMSDLRALLTDAGVRQVQTLLQSGNAVFRADAAPATLESRFADAAAKQLGLTTDFFVRTAAEWRSILAANPFTQAASADPAHLLLMCLKRPPSREAVAALRAAIKGRELIEVKGREAYLVYPDGIGRSRLTTALIEQQLATRGTARNWNTVRKLAALAESI